MAVLLPAPSTVEAAFRIHVLGNDELGDRAVKAVLPPSPEGAAKYILETWREEAVQEARLLYRRRGYFEARVEVRVEEQPIRGDVIASVLVEEGPRYRIDSVAVRTTDATRLAVRAQALDARANRPFDYADILADRGKILRTYADAGYLNVQVGEEIDLHPEKNAASVAYVVDPGRLVRFDTLIVRDFHGDPGDSIEGLTRDDLLRALVPYEKGDTVTLKRNRSILRKLRATGAFDTLALDVRTLDGDTARTALVLMAGEIDPVRLRTAVFYDARFGLGGSVDLRHVNVFGTLNTVGGGAIAAANLQSLFALYSSALTLGYLLDFENRIEAEWNQDDEIHQALETPPFQGDFQFSNNTRLIAPVTGRSSWIGGLELFARSRLIEAGDRRRGLFLNLLNAYAVDWLDNPIDPSRGARFTFIWGNGGPLIRRDEITLTEDRHNWLEALTAYFLPILDPLVLAARLDGGCFFDEGGINTARFFLGGSRTVRAFRFRSLCPEKRQVIADGETVEVCEERGIVPAYYLASAELRLRPFAFGDPPLYGIRTILAPLEAAFFTDYGNVWDLEGEYEFRGPGTGVAFGFGFRYPISRGSTLRLDFAWGLGGAGDEEFAWVIDLAHAF